MRAKNLHPPGMSRHLHAISRVYPGIDPNADFQIQTRSSTGYIVIPPQAGIQWYSANFLSSSANSAKGRDRHAVRCRDPGDIAALSNCRRTRQSPSSPDLRIDIGCSDFDSSHYDLSKLKVTDQEFREYLVCRRRRVPTQSFDRLRGRIETSCVNVRTPDIFDTITVKIAA